MANKCFCGDYTPEWELLGDFDVEEFRADPKNIDELFLCWTKLGAKVAIDYLKRVKHDVITAAMMVYLMQTPQMWNFEMFHGMLHEIFRLLQSEKVSTMLLPAEVLLYIVPRFAPLLIEYVHELRDPSTGLQEYHVVARQLDAMNACVRLRLIKVLLMSRRLELFQTPISIPNERIIAMIEKLGRLVDI